MEGEELDCGIDERLSGNWRSTRKAERRNDRRNYRGCNQSFLDWNTLVEQQVSELKDLEEMRDD